MSLSKLIQFQILLLYFSDHKAQRNKLEDIITVIRCTGIVSINGICNCYFQA